jgi:hypothetical protein
MKSTLESSSVPEWCSMISFSKELLGQFFPMNFLELNVGNLPSNEARVVSENVLLLYNAILLEGKPQEQACWL